MFQALNVQTISIGKISSGGVVESSQIVENLDIVAAACAVMLEAGFSVGTCITAMISKVRSKCHA